MIQSDRRRRDFETPGVMRPTSARTDARKDIVLPLGRRGSAAASAAADAAVGGRRGGGRAATPSSGHAASERRGTPRVRDWRAPRARRRSGSAPGRSGRAGPRGDPGRASTRAAAGAAARSSASPRRRGSAATARGPRSEGPCAAAASGADPGPRARACAAGRRAAARGGRARPRRARAAPAGWPPRPRSSTASSRSRWSRCRARRRPGSASFFEAHGPAATASPWGSHKGEETMACLGLDSEASCGPMAPATRTSRHRWGRGRNKACLLVSYRPLASLASQAQRLL